MLIKRVLHPLLDVLVSGNVFIKIARFMLKETVCNFPYEYVSLRLRVQNVVSAQPCVGKLGISLVLLNFLYYNFRLWLETP